MGDRLNAADIAVAVAWRFAQFRNAEEIRSARYPNLVGHSKRAEALKEFIEVPLD